MNLKKLTVALFLISLAACSREGKWVRIGVRVIQLEASPEELSKVPYRLYSWKKIDRNSDIIDLTIATQSQKAQSLEVILAVNNCKVTRTFSNVPVVGCSADKTIDVYLTGSDEVRSKLLHLTEDEIGAIAGKVLFSANEMPVIFIY